jgi:hypothetical protein
LKKGEKIMTKKFTKALLIAVCALTLVAATFAGTLAYLTAETQAVVNTFTVGKVAIKLDEAKVDANGAIITGEGAGRVEGNGNPINTYKLVPAKTYIKDPKVTVLAGSEKCYLFVKVENAISAYEVAADKGDTIAEQMAANDWSQLTVNDAPVANVYYHAAVDASTSADDMEYPVFGSFTLNGEVDAEDLQVIKDMTITITAYAVQAEGFATAADAWKATFGAPAQP